MKRFSAEDLDISLATDYLLEHGYLVIEGLMGKEERAEISAIAAARQLEGPFEEV